MQIIVIEKTKMIFGDFLNTIREYRKEGYWSEFERLNGQMQLARQLAFVTTGQLHEDHILVKQCFLPPGKEEFSQNLKEVFKTDGEMKVLN